MMQRPKISEKFLVNFLNEYGKPTKAATDIMDTVGNDALYNTMSTVLKKDAPAYTKATTPQAKRTELLNFVNSTNLPHILDDEKLTDASQKDFLINFATAVYIRTLAPPETIEGWMKRHTGQEHKL